MSNRNKIYSKGRIPGQWTALRWEVMELGRLETNEHGSADALYRPNSTFEL